MINGRAGSSAKSTRVYQSLSVRDAGRGPPSHLLYGHNRSLLRIDSRHGDRGDSFHVRENFRVTGTETIYCPGT